MKVLLSNIRQLLLIVNVMPASLCQLSSCLCFLTESQSARIDIYLTLIKND